MAIKMTQQAKTLVIKPSDSSSLPRIHDKMGESTFANHLTLHMHIPQWHMSCPSEQIHIKKKEVNLLYFSLSNIPKAVSFKSVNSPKILIRQ